ncbi:hypothetical protein CLF_101510 [Clonorchis sinensis]|uniref:Uncharacterized protein n=1 Tax=Clonorchis sinensis TaxID=79923 RepID=G7Y5X2_CLOSI|nr:hypothetical protein CLF_101510 [Clonorchis sinensis]
MNPILSYTLCQKASRHEKYMFRERRVPKVTARTTRSGWKVRWRTLPTTAQQHATSGVDVKIQMRPTCAGGVVVTRLSGLSDVQSSKPGTAIGYALLMSSNKSKTRVQCFPLLIIAKRRVIADCLNAPKLFTTGPLRQLIIAKRRVIADCLNAPKLFTTGPLRQVETVQTSMGISFFNHTGFAGQTIPNRILHACDLQDESKYYHRKTERRAQVNYCTVICLLRLRFVFDLHLANDVSLADLCRPAKIYPKQNKKQQISNITIILKMHNDWFDRSKKDSSEWSAITSPANSTFWLVYFFRFNCVTTSDQYPHAVGTDLRVTLLHETLFERIHRRLLQSEPTDYKYTDKAQ